MSYSEEDAKALYQKAIAYGLDGACLISVPETVIAKCNGVGAEWMPEKAREICTALNKYMEAPAAIHDVRYAVGGTEEERAEADLEFYNNVCKVIKADTSVYNPLRYLRLHKAKVFYKLLQKCGDKAWKEANNGLDA